MPRTRAELLIIHDKGSLDQKTYNAVMRIEISAGYISMANAFSLFPHPPLPLAGGGLGRG